ncbi:MAG: hypothetical protein J6V20_02085 [Bacteroidaceae bacterium]|nr:hypothetical protein [Bacteroidaceae bacterium]
MDKQTFRFIVLIELLCRLVDFIWLFSSFTFYLRVNKQRNVMRKFTFLCLFFVGLFTAYAENTYSYLTFETTDGAKFSVQASSLSLTVKGNVLTVGEYEFVVSNLSKMYFSAVNETTTTNVDAVADAVFDDAVEIYNLKGIKVGKKKLARGVYIVKTKDGLNKIVVR